MTHRRLCAFLAAILVATTHEAIAVEGDAALFDLVQAAVRTNPTKYPRGRLRAKVNSVEPGVTVAIEATVVWDGDKTFWDYTVTERADALQGPGQESTQVCRMIETPLAWTVYCPRTRSAHVVRDGVRTYRDQLRLRPDQIWFTMDDHGPWSGYFDLDNFPLDQYHWDVRREDRDRIVVERTYPATGYLLKVVFSLDAGCNIVSYDTDPGKEDQTFVSSGKYEWQQHPSGAWYPRRYSFRSVYGVKQPRLLNDYSLEILEFDPEFAVSPKQFQMDALGIERGTRVKEWERPGRPTVNYPGDRPKPDLQRRLHELAVELR